MVSIRKLLTYFFPDIGLSFDPDIKGYKKNQKLMNDSDKNNAPTRRQFLGRAAAATVAATLIPNIADASSLDGLATYAHNTYMQVTGAQGHDLIYPNSDFSTAIKASADLLSKARTIKNQKYQVQATMQLADLVLDTAYRQRPEFETTRNGYAKEVISNLDLSYADIANACITAATDSKETEVVYPYEHRNRPEFEDMEGFFYVRAGQALSKEENEFDISEMLNDRQKAYLAGRRSHDPTISDREVGMFYSYLKAFTSDDEKVRTTAFKELILNAYQRENPAVNLGVAVNLLEEAGIDAMTPLKTLINDSIEKYAQMPESTRQVQLLQTAKEAYQF